jgi:hypothetical protein
VRTLGSIISGGASYFPGGYQLDDEMPMREVLCEECGKEIPEADVNLADGVALPRVRFCDAARGRGAG